MPPGGEASVSRVAQEAEQHVRGSHGVARRPVSSLGRDRHAVVPGHPIERPARELRISLEAFGPADIERMVAEGERDARAALEVAKAA